MKRARALTRNEVKEWFIEAVWGIVDYWSQVPGKSSYERVRGAVFGVLQLLDGYHMRMPRFSVRPAFSPEEVERHRQSGFSWIPEDMEISGNLHEVFNRTEGER